MVSVGVMVSFVLRLINSFLTSSIEGKVSLLLIVEIETSASMRPGSYIFLKNFNPLRQMS